MGTLTLEQFLALPETEPASEFMCGEAIQKPMPDLPHSRLQAFLLISLFHYLARSPVGIAVAELRCVFGPPARERAFVPDVVFLSDQRLPRGDSRAHRPLRTAPDLAVEILSPGQPAAPFAHKIQFYLLHGVRLVWVIDPDAETIDVFAPGAEPRTLTRADTLDGGDVLPGFSVGLDDVFAQLQT